MTSKYEPLHIAAEVDVDDQLWAGVADYQGQLHLLLAELLDLDQPRARKRLGQTFFLIAVTRGELRAILKEWRASALQFDGDRMWKQKQRRWEKAWASFKRKHLKQAASAWRVRGSFRPQSAARRQNDCAKGRQRPLDLAPQDARDGRRGPGADGPDCGAARSAASASRRCESSGGVAVLITSARSLTFSPADS